MYRRAFFVLSLLLSTTIFAAAPKVIVPNYFEEVQASTRAAPTGNPALLPPTPTKPLLLDGRTSFRVTVCPEEGQYLDGTGYIRLYVYHPYIMGTGRWGYRKELDQTVTLDENITDICQTFGLKVDVRMGFLHPATIGVGTSNSGNVTVRVDPDNF